MTKLRWWQTAVFYQIYPRSFADGNGDGIGDFKGVIAKLDYLSDLGVDAVWLSPHFPSPNWDCGYDITDYTNVAPEYGTLEDFKTFLHEAHLRSIRVILDLVLNHTSDEHPWFIESRSSRNNPKADWYVWADSPLPLALSGAQAETKREEAAEGVGVRIPPNNWQSCFDGDAWTFAPERDQHYYHYFMRQQPDLNWHNPEVKKAMWEAIRFWLDLGVDGYRLDAIRTIYEDPGLTPHQVPYDLAGIRRAFELAQTLTEKKRLERAWEDMFKHQWAQPGLHDLMKELHTLLNEYDGDRMLVGEDDEIAYMGNGGDELHLVFNFPLMRAEQIIPSRIRRNQKERLTQLDALPFRGWPCNTLGNHDSPRIYTRYGDGHHDAELARLHAALVLTLKGTPFLYNGEEIGMTDLIITDPTKLRDTMATWYYDRLINEFSVDPQTAARRAGEMTRDKNRTPMQWSNESNAGFSPPNVETWLPVNPNYKIGVNVQDQAQDPASLLNYYKQLLQIRKTSSALMEGEYLPLKNTAREYFAFLRKSEQQMVLVILNFSKKELELDFSHTKEIHSHQLQILFSSAGRPTMGKHPYELIISPFEVLIAEVNSSHSK